MKDLPGGAALRRFGYLVSRDAAVSAGSACRNALLMARPICAMKVQFNGKTAKPLNGKANPELLIGGERQVYSHGRQLRYGCSARHSYLFQGAHMSSKNGDKSRHHRQRKQKIARRAKTPTGPSVKELASTKKK